MPGRERQQARYRRLAESTLRVARGSSKLEIELADGFDRETLDALIAVERECCPFFTFALDDGRRTLEIGVTEKRFDAALDALAEALDVPKRAA